MKWLLLVALALPLLAADPPAPAAGRNIWDLTAELVMTPEQVRRLNELKAEYDARRAAHQQALRAPDLPPDRRTALVRDYQTFFLALNRRIGELLTEEQRQRAAELRRPSASAKPAASPAKQDDDPAQPPAAAVSRRPSLPPAEYEQLARTLRAAYAKPPAAWPKPQVDPGVKFVELGTLPPVPYPPDNPYSTNKHDLGRLLFFDPRLSASRQIACASCHDPDLAWTDGRTTAFGHDRKPLRRNTPTLLNVAFNARFFWDGRAASLEEQAAKVLLNPDEMRADEATLADRLGRIAGYRARFKAAFGDETITLARVTQAIATFERGLTTRANSFDAFLRGNTNALPDAAVRGLHLFRTEARCVNCHHGPAFTDGQFHNLGLSYYGRALEDLGRHQFTKQPADVGAFKTPTLRNLARTAPYMHNGRFELDGVLNLYNAGMPTLRRKESQRADPLFPTKSPHLKPLGLNAHDLADLKAFLDALTEARVRVRPPELPGEE